MNSKALEVIKLCKYKSIVCATCLSIDRKLFSLQNSCDLLQVCNGLTLSPEDNVCWECRALLSKFVKFKTTALKAQARIMQLPNVTSTSLQIVVPHTLTSLNVTHKNVYDVELNEDVKLEEFLNNEFDMETDFDSVNVTLDCDVFEQNKKEDFEAKIDNFQTDLVNIKQEIEPGLVIVNVPTLRETQKDTKTNKLGKDKKTKTDNKINKRERDKVVNHNASERDVTIVKEVPSYNKKFCKLKILSEQEVWELHEKKKLDKKYTLNIYKCDSCLKGFMNEGIYKEHMQLHSEINGVFECKFCKFRFASESDLRDHETRHTTQYVCTSCDYPNKSMQVVVKHWYNKHGRKIPCDICNEMFSHPRLAEHMRAHKQKWECDVCGKVMANKCTLTKHKRLAHEFNPKVKCPICSKEFSGELRLKTHFNVHREVTDEEIYCVQCNIQFKNNHMYQRHLLYSNKHTNPEQRPECDICKRKFASKTNLATHMDLIHYKKGQHKCEICHMSFNGRVYLRRHFRETHGKGKVKKKDCLCDVCGKSFSITKSLVEHRNTHFGLRPFKCGLCDSTFSFSAALYTHNKLVHLKLGRNEKKRHKNCDIVENTV